MYSIRRFGVVRTATIVALMYMVVIAIIFVPIALLVFVGGSAANGNIAAGGAGLIGTFVVGLFLAVIYGAIGWIFTALACLLYNLVAGWVGGIEVQLEAVVHAGPVAWTPAAPPAQTPPTGPPPAA